MTDHIERRFIPDTDAELRFADDSGRIEGYSALFNSRSSDLGGFRESIAPGAFDNVLKTDDVRALFNHSPNYVLGRMSAGTLTLSVDQRGLRASIDPPDTQYAKDLLVSLRRRDITGMSFGFKVAEGGQRFERQDGVIHRTITKFGMLLDVSPVTFPAYPDTSVAVRSMQEWSTAADEEARAIVAQAVTYSRDLAERRLKLALAR